MMLTEPPRKYAGTFPDLDGTMRRCWAAFHIEARTPLGWRRAASCESLNYAAEMIRERRGLSTAVPAYRVTYGGEILFQHGAA